MSIIYIDKEETEERKRIIENTGNSWFSTADTLIYSSEVLYEEYLKAKKDDFGEIFSGENENEDRKNKYSMQQKMFPIFLMLSGYAIENILKGMIILCGGKTEDFDTGINGHKLNNLVKILKENYNIDMLFEKEEKDTLEKLTEYIIWKGRYPIPNKLRTIQESIIEKFNDGESFHPERFGYKPEIEERVGHYFNPMKLRVNIDNILEKLRNNINMLR